MNKKLQNLITNLSDNSTITLTALLSNQDKFSWERDKQLIISNTPFLTLEMAIIQITANDLNTIPDPKTIQDALIYSQQQKHRHSTSSSPRMVANG